jgi:hypothetical protein
VRRARAFLSEWISLLFRGDAVIGRVVKAILWLAVIGLLVWPPHWLDRPVSVRIGLPTESGAVFTREFRSGNVVAAPLVVATLLTSLGAAWILSRGPRLRVSVDARAHNGALTHYRLTVWNTGAGRATELTIKLDATPEPRLPQWAFPLTLRLSGDPTRTGTLDVLNPDDRAPFAVLDVIVNQGAPDEPRLDISTVNGDEQVEWRDYIFVARLYAKDLSRPKRLTLRFDAQTRRLSEHHPGFMRSLLSRTPGRFSRE